MGAFASQVCDLVRSLIAELKARGMADDPVTRDRIAALAAEAQTARELSRRSILLSGGDYAPLVEAAIAKVYASELAQRLTETLIWLDRHPLPVIAATSHAHRLDPGAAPARVQAGPRPAGAGARRACVRTLLRPACAR